MDVNLLREAVTVLSFGAFIGIVVFALHPKNKSGFEEASLLPLNDEETLSPTLSQGRGSEGGTRFRGAEIK